MGGTERQKRDGTALVLSSAKFFEGQSTESDFHALVWPRCEPTTCLAFLHQQVKIKSGL
jgi:hypothetical protein